MKTNKHHKTVIVLAIILMIILIFVAPNISDAFAGQLQESTIGKLQSTNAL